MSEAERDAYLATERTCRVATVGTDGHPHVVPLWFVWDGSALWLWSLTRSQRWADVVREPRVSAVVDSGEEYDVLRGVEISGLAAPTGDGPRTEFARKYHGSDEFVDDGRHAWLRIEPTKIVSWDFTKIPR